MVSPGLSEDSDRRPVKTVVRSDLGIHDSLLFEASEEHVHGEHLAPEITVVLSIVTARQVPEGRRHVGSCRETGRSKVKGQWRKQVRVSTSFTPAAVTVGVIRFVII